MDQRIESELTVLFEPNMVEGAQTSSSCRWNRRVPGTRNPADRRRDASNRAPLAAVTLAALGASLFAPLELLPGGSTIAVIVGSITPTTLVGFWGSLAGDRHTCVPRHVSRRAMDSSMDKMVGRGGCNQRSRHIGRSSTPSTRARGRSALQVAWLVGLPSAAIAAQFVRRRQSPLAQATKPVVLSLIAALGAFLLLWVLQPELTPGALDFIVVTPRLRAVYALNLLVLLTAAVFLFPVSVSVRDCPSSSVRSRLAGESGPGLWHRHRPGGNRLPSRCRSASPRRWSRAHSAFDGWGGGAAGVALGTCLVLAFQPLRRRVQRAVDRRFYRERYDAREVIDAFRRGSGPPCRSREPSSLSCVSVVQQALRPKSVRLHTGPFSIATQDALERGGCRPRLCAAKRRTRTVQVEWDRGGGAPRGGRISDRCPRPRPSASSDSRYSTLDLELLDRLAQSAGPALQLAYEVRVREKDAQNRERATHELELARKIQQGLLPHGFPEVEGWSFDAFYRPAREVGGDFYRLA